MVSDDDIAKGIESLLRHSDPNSVTTVNAVIQQLQAKLGLDLSHKAAFIRDQIDLLLRSHPTPFLLPQHSTHHYTPQLQPHFPTTHFPSHFPLHPHPPSSHHQINFQHPLPNNAHAIPQNPLPPQLPKRSVPTGGKRKGGAGGLNKVCGVSPELQAVVGESALPRTEIVRQLWAYIRKNNLQDPGNKRKIICDDALRSLFETDCTDMFKMNKLLAKHIIPLGPSKESQSQAKRAKVEAESTFQMAEPVKVETESTFKMTEQVKVDADSTFQMAEQVKVEAESAFLKTEQVKLETESTFQMNEQVKVEAESTFQVSQPASSTVIISEALAKFLGTERREMPQSEVMRLVWEYIKLNHLEDPLNAMMISCDAKLQELLGCESISALGISEMLQRHHLFKKSDSDPSSC